MPGTTENFFCDTNFKLHRMKIQSPRPQSRITSVSSRISFATTTLTPVKGFSDVKSSNRVKHNLFHSMRKLFSSHSQILTCNDHKDNMASTESPNLVEGRGISPSDPLVFGFWKVPSEVCASVCYQAIKEGYRRLDCACDYGNEKEVGEGISNAINDGLCTRDELFVTGKLWNTYHKPEHVPLACQRSLKDLQLSYLDEYLIHFPISTEFVPFEKKYPPEWVNLDGKMVIVANDMCATWKAMEDLVSNGLVQSIGVCNFSIQLLRQILSTCRIRPSTLQIELHPQNSQQKLVRFAHESEMNVTSFSTFGSVSYVELSMSSDADSLFSNPSILKIAEAKKKKPAQILIRWALQRNVFPLTKTVKGERMKENRDVFDFSLTTGDMNVINGLNANRRYNDPGVFCELGMGTFCPIYE